MTPDTCGTCGRAEDHSVDPTTKKMRVELRPYGPGGSLICFECAFGTPEAEERTKRAFMAILDGAQAMGSGVATLTDHGVEPGFPFDALEHDQ